MSTSAGPTPGTDFLDGYCHGCSKNVKTYIGEEQDMICVECGDPFVEIIDTPAPAQGAVCALKPGIDTTEVCLPIIRQPLIDVEAGNPLVRVYVDMCEWESHRKVIFRLVFEGESAWNCNTCTLDEKATEYYRANNSNVWNRTADVDMFYLLYDETDKFDPSVQPIGVGFGAFSGPQSFFRGNKKPLSIPMLLPGPIAIFDDFLDPDVPEYRSKHNNNVYRVIPWEFVTKEAGRPILYANTCNHLLHTINNNPEMPFRSYDDVHFEYGSREDTELFASTCVENKANKQTCTLLKTLGIKF
eukprot:GFYU01000863.1.p1 GENE.GFYU01000863.1~~GFYU01000863.1.p1  ORF type:complete len:300 (+),score=64.16 GFYU01000863.1:31-930(+)